MRRRVALGGGLRGEGLDRVVELAPMCGEPLASPLGPLPPCCLPVGHRGDHDPYGRPT